MCFFFHETIAYLKGNSKIKEKFFQENSYTEIRKTYFLAPKLGVDLYTGSTYTRVNTVTDGILGPTRTEDSLDNQLLVTKSLEILS